MVGTLGSDAACASVRVGAINGLHDLLKNPLAHTALKGLLPTMSNSVHDYSERVRLSFIQLLSTVRLGLKEGHVLVLILGVLLVFLLSVVISLEWLSPKCFYLSPPPVQTPLLLALLYSDIKLYLHFYIQVKTTRGFKFYDIVPIERLCDQLSVDSSRPAICLALSGLLVNSLYPRAGDVDVEEETHIADYSLEQVKRCLTFIRKYEPAAIVFYQYLHKHTSIGSATKLCVLLWSLLYQPPQGDENTNNNSSNTVRTIVSQGVDENDAEGSVKGKKVGRKPKKGLEILARVKRRREVEVRTLDPIVYI